ncbi:hypothetical protein GCM10009744_54020 [Kribbella alba]|uniref:Transcriptional regulator, AbiEi antitoxin, Type IV TA system n=1 Tax=Kribbella alba TaxID=190197 RepID=A0ABN2FNF0_9ACTN
MKKLGDDVHDAVRAAIDKPLRLRELKQLGLSDNDVRRLLRSSSLQRSHAHYIDGELEARLAAVLCARAAHPKSVISHFSAAALSDLRVWTDNQRDDRPLTEAVWLTCVPGKRRRNQKRDDVVLRRAGLTAADLQHHRGLLLTSDARTTVDLARELPLREAMVTVDHALAASVTRTELELVLQRQRRWPGVQRARLAVEFGDPRSESVLESIARVAFAAAGLPAPELQAQFWDGARWTPERVDFWWPQFGTVAEADGLEKFDAPTARERRRLLRRNFERDQRLADLGLELLHFGWEDAVLKPDELAERLRAAFARGSRRTDHQPTWRTTDPTDPALWPTRLDLA